MGKACDCWFLMAAVEGDARLQCLPLAVRMLWLVLVRKMQQMGQVALMLGSDVPKPSEVALLATCTETELETHLEPLLARGLLVRRADGALESPLLLARQARANTARINGLKGGRPRKPAPPGSQREMIMAVPGGRAVGDPETQGKPSDAGVGSVAKLAKTSLEEEAKPAGAGADWQRVGELAMEAAGFDPVRWVGHCGQVRTWLSLGASEGLILSTIRRVMARPGVRPQHFGYFDKAVREAMAEAAPVAVQPASLRVEAYAAAFDAWQRGGMCGPAPELEAA